MSAREPGSGGRALAFFAGAVFVVVLAAVVYLVFGVGAQSRRLHVAVNAPSARALAPPNLPSPTPGPPQ